MHKALKSDIKERSLNSKREMNQLEERVMKYTAEEIMKNLAKGLVSSMKKQKEEVLKDISPIKPDPVIAPKVEIP